MKVGEVMYKSKGLRDKNIQQVKDYFLENKYAIKSEIANATKLSQATITTILQELLENNYIERVGDCESTGGRKAKRYKICAQFMYFGLLQFQVVNEQIKINCRVIDLEDQSVYERELWEITVSIEKIVSIIQDMRSKYAFQYMGISIPAIVDEGLLTKSDIEELADIHLKQSIEEALSLQVVVENDVNTAMLGYIHLHSMEGKSIAFVYQPDNHHSGCSLYINEAIVYGATHFAGELAYLPNGTLQQQEVLLKEDPITLLCNQVQSIIAIVNPSHMILYVPCIKQEIFKEILRKWIPEKHIPEILYIETMEEYIFTGLTYLCMQSSRYHS